MLLSDDNAEDTRPIRLVMSDLQYQWYELPEHLGNKTSCLTFWRSPLIITLVLFILTLIPLLSMLTFHSLDMASLTITNNSGLNAEPLLPQNFCCYHDLFWRLFLHLCTSLPILAILQLPAYNRLTAFDPGLQHTDLHTTTVQPSSHNEWYVVIGNQWYQLPELIPTNSNSGFHSCDSISIHVQRVTYVTKLIHSIQLCTGPNIHTSATCTSYQIQAALTNEWLRHF